MMLKIKGFAYKTVSIVNCINVLYDPQLFASSIL